MRAALEAVHFYRRVPRDISKGTAQGGVLSVVAAVSIVALIFTNTAAFLRVNLQHEVRVDQIYDHEIRVNLNLTLHRLPCQLVSLDIFDAMGASVHNLTYGVQRTRISGLGERSPFKPTKRSKTWEIKGRRLEEPVASDGGLGSEQGLRQLNSEGFERFIKEKSLSVVLFGATWCNWTKQLLPVFAKVNGIISTDAALRDELNMAVVDCSRREAREVCVRNHLLFFPVIHIYHSDSSSLHQNYIGPRDAQALVTFLKSIVHSVVGQGGNLSTPIHGHAVRSERGSEGCELYGSFFVSRVPGNLRISAHSPEHSFNPRWIDLDHTITTFSFGVPDVPERHRHELMAQRMSERQERSILLEHDGDGGAGARVRRPRVRFCTGRMSTMR